MMNFVVRSPEAKRATFVHRKGRCVIGTDPGSDLRLNGWRVSKLHAEFFLSNDNLYVRDLNSSFGTFVNDTRVETYGPLGPGDEVKVGAFSLSVAMSRKPAAEAAPQGGAPAAAPAVIQVTAPSGAAGVAATRAEAGAGNTAQPATVREEQMKWRRLLHDKLLESIDLRRTDVHRMNDTELRAHTEKMIRQIMTISTAFRHRSIAGS